MAGRVFEDVIEGFIYREYDRIDDARLLVTGLPDVGLVGSISAAFIVRELEMEDAVGIDNPVMLPPVVVVHEGEPKYPIRVYSSRGLSVLLTDIPIPPPAIAPFSASIIQWARMRRFEMLIGVTGLGHPRRIDLDKPGLHYLAVGEKAKEAAREVGAEKLGNGMLVGPMALMLKEAERAGIDMLVIMVDAFMEIPDPEAAAVAVQAIAKLAGFQVNVDKLLKEAEQLKLRYRDLMKETRNVMAKLGKGYEYRSPLLFT